jgi:hypothetical protein
MNRIGFSFLILGLGIAVAMPSPHAKADGTMEKFVLSTCKAEGQRCLKATAERAEGSQFKPIFVLRSLEVTMIDQSKSEKTVSVSERGYIDLENNRLVMDTKNGEKAFDLEKLSVTEWKLK